MSYARRYEQQALLRKALRRARIPAGWSVTPAKRPGRDCHRMRAARDRLRADPDLCRGVQTRDLMDVYGLCLNSASKLVQEARHAVGLRVCWVCDPGPCMTPDECFPKRACARAWSD